MKGFLLESFQFSFFMPLHFSINFNKFIDYIIIINNIKKLYSTELQKDLAAIIL